MDIREAFDSFIEKYGHDVIYVRRDLKFRCNCYVERSGEHQSICNKCLGTGYDVQIERVRVRRNIVTVPESLVGLQTHAQQGVFTPKAYVYYISEKIQPKDTDLILEVEWSALKKPKRIIQRHVISVAEPKQGDQGRVEFYQVYCKYEGKGDSDDQTISGNPV